MNNGTATLRLGKGSWLIGLGYKIHFDGDTVATVYDCNMNRLAQYSGYTFESI